RRLLLLPARGLLTRRDEDPPFAFRSPVASFASHGDPFSSPRLGCGRSERRPEGDRAAHPDSYEVADAPRRSSLRGHTSSLAPMAAALLSSGAGLGKSAAAPWRCAPPRPRIAS